MQNNSSNPLFYLHIPFEMVPGYSFEVSHGGRQRMTVLGHDATLFEALSPIPDNRMASRLSSIIQWIVFDPIQEQVARELYAEFCGRMHEFAFRTSVPICIRSNDLVLAEFSEYKGDVPALVPANFNPAPIFETVGFSRQLLGKHALEVVLPDCNYNVDHRIIAALSMYESSLHGSSIEAAFLKLVTILDYLAADSERPEHIQKWLDDAIARSKELGDPALQNGLSMLKKSSRGNAIKALVRRAARIEGHSDEKIVKLQKFTYDLYRIRSTLSHDGVADLQGSTVIDARELVAMIIEAALVDLTVLDADSNSILPESK